jgi:hypothetical protein
MSSRSSGKDEDGEKDGCPRVVLCHFSNQGNDTAALAKRLDRFSNMYVDISARDYEIGRQPRTMKAFLEKYKGRVMFGTDMGRDKQMYLKIGDVPWNGPQN